MNDLKSIIINIISGFMTDDCVSFFERRRFKKYKKELEKWIQEYVDKNDGTIVTSGAFANFVMYQKPVEKILAYIYESYNQTLTEEMFLDSLCNLMKACMEIDCLKIKPEEERVVKDFFQGIYDSYKKYVAKGLSMKDRNLLAIMAQVRCGNVEILKRIDEQSSLTRQQSLVLNSYIANREMSESDDNAIWQMYHELDKLILAGKIELIQGILPICCYGNQNIDQALRLKLDILCKSGHEKNEIIRRLERISISKIRDDVIRFMIFTIKDAHFFKEILPHFKKIVSLQTEAAEGVNPCISKSVAESRCREMFFAEWKQDRERTLADMMVAVREKIHFDIALVYLWWINYGNSYDKS